MKILLTGATGLIGKKLGEALVRQQHQVYIISRSQASSENLSFVTETIVGDLSKGPIHDPRLSAVEGVINLAGEPVAEGRWTEAKKKRIYDSRIQGTKNLLASLSAAKPEVFVNSSAVGYYGDRKDETLHEDSVSGTDFLAHVCVDWERALQNFSGRKVFIRTGFVLSSSGGALEKMLPAFKLGLGGKLAGGHQWMSWVHIEDLVNMYVWAIENKAAQGPYNGAAPHPVTNSQFTEALVKTLGKTKGPAVPLFALKILFGEMAEMLVASQKASSQRLQSEGFQFKYSFLPEALHNLLARK